MRPVARTAGYSSRRTTSRRGSAGRAGVRPSATLAVGGAGLLAGSLASGAASGRIMNCAGPASCCAVLDAALVAVRPRGQRAGAAGRAGAPASVRIAGLRADLDVPEAPGGAEPGVRIETGAGLRAKLASTAASQGQWRCLTWRGAVAEDGRGAHGAGFSGVTDAGRRETAQRGTGRGRHV
jgi:hypothetical protein